MISVIKREDAIYYVDEADFIAFVEKNSEYEWNNICDICRNEVFNESGKTYFKKYPTGELSSEFTVTWVSAFFNAHPFMERIMFVFDDYYLVVGG
jgi:hypothetical protein